jgi:hypothetical protein
LLLVVLGVIAKAALVMLALVRVGYAVAEVSTELRGKARIGRST